MEELPTELPHFVRWAPTDTTKNTALKEAGAKQNMEIMFILLAHRPHANARFACWGHFGKHGVA